MEIENVIARKQKDGEMFSVMHRKVEFMEMSKHELCQYCGENGLELHKCAKSEDYYAVLPKELEE